MRRPRWLSRDLAITWTLLVGATMAMTAWGRDSLISLVTVAMYALGSLMWCKAAYYRGSLSELKVSREYFSLLLSTLHVQASEDDWPVVERAITRALNTTIGEQRRLQEGLRAAIRARGH